MTKQTTLALASHKRAHGVLGDNEYEDDGNYGSAATIDVEVLQAISKRVHYGEYFSFLLTCSPYSLSTIGKFVSESKFRSHPEQFIPHIRNPNPSALEALITKPEVEAALLRRVRNKAKQYGQDLGPDGQPLPSPGAQTNGNATISVGFATGKIDVNFIVEMYEDYIIPLTKEVEVCLGKSS